MPTRNQKVLLTSMSGVADTEAPSVSTFTATSPSTSLDIPITAFTASEEGVSFIITESSTPPEVDAAGWSETAPETYTVAEDDTYTLYPWVKDAAGNVSAEFDTPVSVVVDTTAPTVAITLSDYAFKTGDTATVTFTFSEEPTGFAEADITAPNGTLSAFGVTADPLVYEATFTPDADVSDATNVITVGTSWTDAAGNAPAGSTTSDNYAVDTVAPTVTIAAVYL